MESSELIKFICSLYRPAILAVVAGLGISADAATGQYDLSRDFSTAVNPNGVWTYGAQTALGGSITLLAYVKTYSADNGVPLADWQLTSSLAPTLARNMG